MATGGEVPPSLAWTRAEAGGGERMTAKTILPFRALEPISQTLQAGASFDSQSPGQFPLLPIPKPRQVPALIPSASPAVSGGQNA